MLSRTGKEGEQGRVSCRRRLRGRRQGRTGRHLGRRLPLFRLEEGDADVALVVDVRVVDARAKLDLQKRGVTGQRERKADEGWKRRTRGAVDGRARRRQLEPIRLANDSNDAPLNGYSLANSTETLKEPPLYGDAL